MRALSLCVKFQRRVKILSKIREVIFRVGSWKDVQTGASFSGSTLSSILTRSFQHEISRSSCRYCNRCKKKTRLPVVKLFAKLCRVTVSSCFSSIYVSYRKFKNYWLKFDTLTMKSNWIILFSNFIHYLFYEKIFLSN